jgi:maltose 6'-phosphate phosphatase
MKISMVCRVLLTLVVIGSLALPSPSRAEGSDSELNVMTINLLFSEVEDREERLDRIANFVNSYPEPIDLILLQEVVGGALSKTANSALDLKNKLAEKGAVTTTLAIGWLTEFQDY